MTTPAMSLNSSVLSSTGNSLSKASSSSVKVLIRAASGLAKRNIRSSEITEPRVNFLAYSSAVFHRCSTSFDSEWMCGLRNQSIK